MNGYAIPNTASDHVPFSWRQAGLLLVFAAALIGFVAPAAAPLLRLWSHSFTYSHGYLILALAVWLVYRQFRAAPLRRLAPSYLGVIALALCASGILAAQASQTQIVSLALLPLLLCAALHAVAGWRQAQPYFFGIGYLYFAIPGWDYVNEPLRALTTNVVTAMVRVSGMPAFIEGNFIYVPSGVFEVAGGCSGLHFFIVALALAALYSLLQYKSWRARWLLGLIAASLAVMANWVRVFVLVAVGHLTEMQHYLIQEDHYVFGWVLFVVALVPLFIAARLLENRDAIWAGAPNDESAAASSSSGSGGRQSRDAVALTSLGERDARRSQAALLISAVAVIGIAAALAWRVDALAKRPSSATAITLLSPPGWIYDAEWSGASRPIYRGAGAEAAARYVRGDRTVSIYFADYPVQRQGSEVVFYANRPQGEERVRARRTQANAGPESVPFTELELASADGRPRLVWYTMQVAGRTTGSELTAKLYQVLGALVGRGDAQVLVLSAECESRCEEARPILAQFAAHVAVPLFESSEVPE